MKRISEQNIFPNFDIQNEYEKIEALISEKRAIQVYTRDFLSFSLTVEGFVEIVFSNWRLRGTFLSLDEMRSGLGIPKDEFSYMAIQEGDLLNFLQYAMNCLFYAASCLNDSSKVSIGGNFYHFSDRSYFESSALSIQLLLSHLGVTYHTDEETGEIYLRYKDEVADAIIEQNPEVARSLTEYLQVGNQGDLQRKGEILCTLWKRFESTKDSLSESGYELLRSNTGFLFNKTGIRHWVENDKIASATFLKMTEEELEEWYDKTYDLFVACMAVLPTIAIGKEIKKIKKIAEGEASECKSHRREFEQR